MTTVNLVALHLVSHERHVGHIRFLFKWKFLASISSFNFLRILEQRSNSLERLNGERHIISTFNIVYVMRLWLRSLQRDNTFYYLCNDVNDLF